MKQLLNVVFIATLLVTSCTTEGVKKSNETPVDQQQTTQRVDSLELDLPVQDHMKLNNGIEIVWLEKSSGESIQAGDVVMIDYKVRLKDSTIIDGNHLLNKPALPYLAGFGFQPKGWDLALAHLKIGDFARIKLPAEFARGKKGVKNLIPENADNYLTIRILSKRKPDRIIDGTKVWVLEENKANKTVFNETNSIVFHTTISSPSAPFYFNSYANQQPFELKLEDNGTVPGLKKALINAKKGDRLFILVPSGEAYGAKGYLDIVKPNEDLFYNLLVMDIID
ncbi:FKBP-type peptidyl-prolyl cis-trans isomerase [Crocinitomicaceae bacterium CZZ-1]|uniref:Peptidyl-prolyl cis-trans isomerase n=1 Tax=Taishania pollutisoli TaxID=2766479 RepID=A0A8J6PLZ2_9FLAO|nr:FKBP-type peptidyl-prolyl cis-trans isomerase [Taishania pollutisoli]MBC9813230.1 FKBP-type peptidyl-prolyl cis-trans isomerase [Taishania pollutisoli]